MHTNFQTFEKFLEGKCPSHTNNSPEGFENWLADLDVQDVMDYAENWGSMQYTQGKQDLVEYIRPTTDKMSEILARKI